MAGGGLGGTVRGGLFEAGLQDGGMGRFIVTPLRPQPKLMLASLSLHAVCLRPNCGFLAIAMQLMTSVRVGTEIGLKF